jgi:hypothetical protein
VVIVRGGTTGHERRSAWDPRSPDERSRGGRNPDRRSTPAFAQAPLPIGSQFQVNSYTLSTQSDASIAANRNGFVVSWSSNGSSGTDSHSTSIQAQRYAADGSSQGAEFQVNSYTTLSQTSPSVGMAPSGDFVVVWESFRSAGSDTSFASIQGQRYASDGAPQGAQFQVNSYTTNYQRDPSVAISPDGRFVVVWTSVGSPGTDGSLYSVQGQRFSADGSTQGAQFQVNNFTTNDQFTSDVAVKPDGGFVVVWSSYGSSQTDHSGESIQGQRYASDGATQGAQFQINTFTSDDQFRPSLAANAKGTSSRCGRARTASGVGVSI